MPTQPARNQATGGNGGPRPMAAGPLRSNGNGGNGDERLESSF
jgi:hypothetical protein